ncbi:MAG: LemA family protein [Sebaldella sp.]|nr:LemA family protein [Sebaldella sp.]
MGIFLIILGIIVLLAVMVAGIYNRYIRLKNLNKEGWSGVEVHLQKRWDLIPNLVNTVKGYATHEKETLENVVKLRTQIMSIDTKDVANIEEVQKLENELTKTLRSIMMLQEAYPDLKANQNFLELQNNLNQIEEDIKNSRKYYNGTVRDLNTFVESFPNNILAGMFNFKTAEFFDANDEVNKAPEVKF